MGNNNYQKKKKKVPSTDSLPQMATIARAGPTQSQEELLPGLLQGCQELDPLDGHLLSCLLLLSQASIRELFRSGAAKTDCHPYYMLVLWVAASPAMP